MLVSNWGSELWLESADISFTASTCTDLPPFSRQLFPCGKNASFILDGGPLPPLSTSADSPRCERHCLLPPPRRLVSSSLRFLPHWAADGVAGGRAGGREFD